MEQKGMEVSVPEYTFFTSVLLDPKKTGIIVGDMLVDFVTPQGKLFVPESPQTILPIKNLIARARGASARVIFIQDWHRPDDPEFSIWGPHSVEGTPGAEIIPELAPLPGEFIVRKRTYDPFWGTDLELLLRQSGIHDLVITGTVANICVLQTAGSASLRGFRIVIPKDTISALSSFDYQVALRQISFVYRGEITTSDRIRFRKKSAARAYSPSPSPESAEVPA